MTPLYELLDPSALLSPSLIVFRDIVRHNLEEMIRIAGGIDRLRPHAKTHKMPGVIQMERELGIVKHKCATIAEAEMIARAGGTDVLLAYPLVGPNIGRFVKLIQQYPDTTFRAVADAPEPLKALSDAARALKQPIPTLLDLDVGMGRTGIALDAATPLYRQLANSPGLSPDGLHAYDGHIRDTNLEDRTRAALAVERAVLGLRDQLTADGLPVPRIVLGGTPTFPIHAKLDAPGVECSPGTIVFHDANYRARFPDLPFTPAALLLTRVVSRPGPNRLCFDLGHKAVAADPSGPRAEFPDIPDAKIVGHSEEHLVIETTAADRFPIGAPILAIPAHVCPTSALHQRATVVSNGQVVDEWEVAARDRVIGV